jgi:hypothetical protein
MVKSAFRMNALCCAAYCTAPAATPVPGVPFALAAQFSVFAIASLQKETI